MSKYVIIASVLFLVWLVPLGLAALGWFALFYDWPSLEWALRITAGWTAIFVFSALCAVGSMSGSNHHDYM